MPDPTELIVLHACISDGEGSVRRPCVPRVHTTVQLEPYFNYYKVGYTLFYNWAH